MGNIDIPKGLNQRQLADILGVDKITVNRWKNGKVIPSIQVQRHLELLNQLRELTGNYPVYKQSLGKRTSKLLIQGDLFG